MRHSGQLLMKARARSALAAMIRGFTGNLAARFGRWIWAEQVFGIACRYDRQKLDRQRPVEPDPEVERAGSIGCALTAIPLD
jgi:hypothetical protein